LLAVVFDLMKHHAAQCPHTYRIADINLCDIGSLKSTA
jgi:hypothetical protein